MSDEKGKFRFDRVFPGENRVEYDVDRSSVETTSSTRVAFSAVAGETKRIRLGGNGITVTGQFLFPNNKTEDLTWETFFIQLRENRPRKIAAAPVRFGANGLEDRVVQPEQVVQRQTLDFYATPDREGRFRIEDVPEGDWILSAAAGNHQVSADATVVAISPDDIAAGDAGKAKNIGDIQTHVRR